MSEHQRELGSSGIDITCQNCLKNNTQKETDAYLAAIKGAIINAMADGDEVAIPGLVKFVVVDVPARTVRNPQTGEVIQVPAKKKVKVKVLGELKEYVL